MDIEIRECKFEDLTEFTTLFEVVEELHRQGLPSRFRKPAQNYPETFLKQTLADSSSKIFVAKNGQALVGYIHIMIKQTPNDPIINPGKLILVEQLSVDPKARRQRVGSELMKFSESYAKQSGFSEIELNVWKFNEDAEQFYRSLGYNVARTYLSKKL